MHGHKFSSRLPYCIVLFGVFTSDWYLKALNILSQYFFPHVSFVVLLV